VVIDVLRETRREIEATIAGQAEVLADYNAELAKLVSAREKECLLSDTLKAAAALLDPSQPLAETLTVLIEAPTRPRGDAEHRINVLRSYARGVADTILERRRALRQLDAMITAAEAERSRSLWPIETDFRVHA
jgi:hypothetical protein